MKYMKILSLIILLAVSSCRKEAKDTDLAVQAMERARAAEAEVYAATEYMIAVLFFVEMNQALDNRDNDSATAHAQSTVTAANTAAGAARQNKSTHLIAGLKQNLDTARSVGVATAHPDAYSQAIQSLITAESLYQQGDYEKSMEASQNGLDILKPLIGGSESLALSNLNRARELLDRAYKSTDLAQTSNSLSQVSNTVNLAANEYQTQQYTSSISNSQHAIELLNGLIEKYPNNAPVSIRVNPHNDNLQMQAYDLLRKLEKALDFIKQEYGTNATETAMDSNQSDANLMTPSEHTHLTNSSQPTSLSNSHPASATNTHATNSHSADTSATNASATNSRTAGMSGTPAVAAMHYSGAYTISTNSSGALSTNYTPNAYTGGVYIISTNANGVPVTNYSAGAYSGGSYTIATNNGVISTNYSPGVHSPAASGSYTAHTNNAGTAHTNHTPHSTHKAVQSGAYNVHTNAGAPATNHAPEAVHSGSYSVRTNGTVSTNHNSGHSAAQSDGDYYLIEYDYEGYEIAPVYQYEYIEIDVYTTGSLYSLPQTFKAQSTERFGTVTVTESNTSASTNTNNYNPVHIVTIDEIDIVYKDGQDYYNSASYLNAIDKAREGLRLTDLFLANQVLADHTVERGNTLWGIAIEYYDTPWLWPNIWRANKLIIKDPDLIYIDQVFKIPPSDQQ